MQALKDYAELEYELCLLLKAILKVEAPVASAIFYNIANTRSRYSMMDGLLEIRHPDTYRKPWKKIEHWLTPRDTARNHIVHWGQDVRIVVVAKPGPSGMMSEGSQVEVHHSLALTNSARRWRDENVGAKAYSEDDIRTEAFKTRVMKHIVNRYNLSVFFPDKWPWTDIFQQPITDPTPEAFLQRLNDRGYPALA